MSAYDLFRGGAGTLMGTYCLLLLMLQLFNTAIAGVFALPRRRLAAHALLLGALALLLLPLISAFGGDYAPTDVSVRLMRAVPWFSLPLLTLLLTGLTVLSSARLIAWRRTHITVLSIKESIDRLPTGICFGDGDGAAVMVNLTMDRIGTELTGLPIRSTRRFWEELAAHRDPESEGDNPIVRLRDGRAFYFHREPSEDGSARLEQITAVDITDLYAMTLALREKRAQLTDLKRRHLRYAENVTAVTREREILAAKLAVHDDVGHALLAATHYLSEPDGADPAEVLETWRKTIALLSGGGVPDREVDAAATLIRAALSVGIEVTVDGALPDENPARNVILNALHECITNTLRHAHGDRLHLAIGENASEYVVTLVNNGDAPKGPIRETGGLKLLRQMAESSGGGMTVRIAPEFALTITIPKGEEL